MAWQRRKAELPLQRKLQSASSKIFEARLSLLRIRFSGKHHGLLYMALLREICMRMMPCNKNACKIVIDLVYSPYHMHHSLIFRQSRSCALFVCVTTHTWFRWSDTRLTAAEPRRRSESQCMCDRALSCKVLAQSSPSHHHQFAPGASSMHGWRYLT